MRVQVLMMAAAAAAPAHAAGGEALRCPATVAEANALLARLPQTKMIPAERAAMAGNMYLGGGRVEERTFDGRALNVLGARPDKVVVSYYQPGVPSSISFWVPGQDKARYSAAFTKVAPPLEYPCDGNSGCSWWAQKPPIGALQTIELADSIFEKAHLRFTCSYRSY
jgi:hypothetical protein